MILKTYSSWSLKVGLFMGVLVTLLYTFLLDTVQEIQTAIFFFILFYAIICLFDAIIEVNIKRRAEKVKRLWK